MANLSDAFGTIEFPQSMRGDIDVIRNWINSFSPTGLTEEQKADMDHYKYLWEYGFNSFDCIPEKLSFPKEGPLIVKFYGTGRWSFEACLEHGAGTITDTNKEDIALAKAIALSGEPVVIDFYDEEGGCDLCAHIEGVWQATLDAAGKPRVEWTVTNSEDLERTTDVLSGIFGYDCLTTDSAENMEEIYSAYTSGREDWGEEGAPDLSKKELKKIIDKSPDMKGKVLIEDVDNPVSLYDKIKEDPLYKVITSRHKEKKEKKKKAKEK